jgi:hypothetical protein
MSRSRKQACPKHGLDHFSVEELSNLDESLLGDVGDVNVSYNRLAGPDSPVIKKKTRTVRVPITKKQLVETTKLKKIKTTQLVEVPDVKVVQKHIRRIEQRPVERFERVWDSDTLQFVTRKTTKLKYFRVHKVKKVRVPITKFKEVESIKYIRVPATAVERVPGYKVIEVSEYERVAPSSKRGASRGSSLSSPSKRSFGRGQKEQKEQKKSESERINRFLPESAVDFEESAGSGYSSIEDDLGQDSGSDCDSADSVDSVDSLDSLDSLDLVDANGDDEGTQQEAKDGVVEETEPGTEPWLDGLLATEVEASETAPLPDELMGGQTENGLGYCPATIGDAHTFEESGVCGQCDRSVDEQTLGDGAEINQLDAAAAAYAAAEGYGDSDAEQLVTISIIPSPTKPAQVRVAPAVDIASAASTMEQALQTRDGLFQPSFANSDGTSEGERERLARKKKKKSENDAKKEAKFWKRYYREKYRNRLAVAAEAVEVMTSPHASTKNSPNRQQQQEETVRREDDDGEGYYRGFSEGFRSAKGDLSF